MEGAGGRAGGAWYVGLDAGTQGVKCGVWELGAGGRPRAVGCGAAALAAPARPREGAAEQEPADWLRAARAAVRGALAEAGPPEAARRVVALGVSGQQHGLVAVDAAGRPVRACKLWCDTESHAEAAELSGALGSRLGPAFTASKLLWLARHEPERYAETSCFLLPKDYINFYLTGRRCTECSDASGTGLLDVGARRWLPRGQLERLLPGLAVKMPELLGPDQAVGRLREEAAREWGLEPGVLVAPGGGDNAMAALGVGAVREGDAVVSLGTSGTLFCFSGRPVLDPSGAVNAFCDCTGNWLPLMCTMNCTGATEEVRGLFPDLGLERLTAMAREEAPGCSGVNFLPYLGGERTPDWPHASGALMGLRPGSLQRPGLLFRAALEGATFSLKSALAEGMKGRDGSDAFPAFSELRVVGGGAKNALWCEILAQVLGVKVVAVYEPEAAARGAALQAMAVHLGAPVRTSVAERLLDGLLDEPAEGERGASRAFLPRGDAEADELYAQAFRRHQQLGERLFA